MKEEITYDIFDAHHSLHCSTGKDWGDGNIFDREFISPLTGLSAHATSFTHDARITRPHMVITR